MIVLAGPIYLGQRRPCHALIPLTTQLLLSVYRVGMCLLAAHCTLRTAHHRVASFGRGYGGSEVNTWCLNLIDRRPFSSSTGFPAHPLVYDQSSIFACQNIAAIQLSAWHARLPLSPRSRRGERAPRTRTSARMRTGTTQVIHDSHAHSRTGLSSVTGLPGIPTLYLHLLLMNAATTPCYNTFNLIPSHLTYLHEYLCMGR
ncbi:hypothetical protein F5Y15DRAFT_293112 [Xylariaceae sp. FL0016]|nr:hypothetical protein F5Y15DRAFT_293112 [Xylariaceae sp. FL0016]